MYNMIADGKESNEQKNKPNVDDRGVDTANTNTAIASSTWAEIIDAARRSKRAVVSVVALALFTDMVLYDMIVPILPTLLRSVGKNERHVGILFAVYAAGFLLTVPAFGIWSDRARTRKLPMILGQTSLAIATIMFATARTFWWLILARLLQGAAAAVSWTLGLALLADAVPKDELGKAMGIVLGFNTLGFFVGPLIGGVLTQTVNIRLPFYICSGLCAIDLLGRALIKPPPVASSAGDSKNAVIGKLLQNPSVLFIGLAVIATSLSFSAIEALLASHLQHRYGLDVMGVSLCMMAIIIPSVACSFLAGWLADRYCRYRMILIAACLYMIATPLLGLSNRLWTFLVASVYLGATSSMLQTPALPEMATIVSKLGGGSYAQVYGIVNIFYSMGLLLGPLLASWLNDAGGFVLAMCLIATPFLLVIPAFTWLSCKYRSDPQDRGIKSPEKAQIAQSRNV